MTNDDIQGTVTDANGNAVGGAIVALWDQDNPNNVVTTTADSNGNYIFEDHPNGDGTSTNWHVAARDPTDGTRQFPSLHSVSAQLPNAIPASGISRYNFEQDLTDAWGGNNGRGAGGITYTTDNQEGSYAVVLDGTDDVIDVGGMSDLEGLSELSMLGWIKPKPGALSGDNYGVYFQTSGNFTARFGIRFGRNGNLLGFSPNEAKDAPIGTTYSNISTGTWYHIAGVFDGPNSDFRWYLEGSQGAVDTASTIETPSTGNNGKFGVADDWGPNAPIEIDRFEFHNKALTQTEVQNHKDTGSING